MLFPLPHISFHNYMQTLTFTQKLLRQRNFFGSLIPLFALFLGLGASQTAVAQSYNFDNITISSAPSGGTPAVSTYDGTLDPNGINPPFEKVDLGDGAFFNLSTGSLRITAASTNLQTPASKPITFSNLKYRVYPTGTTSALPSFSTLGLTQTSASNTGNPVAFAASADINVLNQPAVLGGGNYTLEVIFNSNFTAISRGLVVPNSLNDPAGAVGYRATFRVTPPIITPAGGITTWISNGVAPRNTNWLNPLNWSNGVPTRNSSASIPGKAPSDPFTVTPLLDDPSALYEVQNLTLQNADNNFRALVRVGQSLTGGSPTGATLRIYGNLDNLGGGILASVSGTNGTANPLTNSTVVFAGDATTFNLDPNGVPVLTGGNQIIRGLTTVVDTRIEGTGIKAVVNTIQATNTFTFATANAIVRTVFDDGMLTRNTSKTANIELGTSGFLFNETRNAFIDGVTLSSRTLQAGVPQTFGNIGVDITPDRNIPAPDVIITRTIGAPFFGPVGPGGTPVAVKRQYGVSGDVNNNTRSTVVFHYLDSDGVNSPFNELNTNPEPRLVIFRTGNNGIPFQLVGGIVDLENNTVTQTGVSSINTITLGDRDNPLPVVLTAFDAKRIGNDALVTWETASEINNKGFNVQISVNGKTFRNIGFVASASPNSSRRQAYSFTDTEKNKVGLRYYRLQQIDIDGKTAFFTPRAVSFDGKSSDNDNAVVATYPNPFTSDVRLNLRSSVEGQALVNIMDMTGRTLEQRRVALVGGNNDVEILNLGNLKGGIYLMRVILPAGETRSVRIVKQ